MARKYRKIDPRIWSDERFVSLSEDEKLLALYCLTSPQGNRIGIFRFSLALAAEDLDTSPGTCGKRFRHVCHTMRWQFDEACKVLYFPTWWKYNEPENGSVLLGNLEDLHDVPAGKLVDSFLANTTFLKPSYRVRNGKDWSDRATVEMLESCRHMSSSAGTRVPHVDAQEQEQEQEQEQDISGPQGGKKKFVPPTVEEVAAYCQERGNGIDAEKFVASYTSKGWMVGKNKMKDWRAAVITWEKNRGQFGAADPTDQDRTPAFPPRRKL